MRRFLGLDFTTEQVPDATTLLHFRHLLEKHNVGEKLLQSQAEMFEEQGWIMRGGSIVDAHDHRRAVIDEERRWCA